jgi:hypothetical protein
LGFSRTGIVVITKPVIKKIIDNTSDDSFANISTFSFPKIPALVQGARQVSAALVIQPEAGVFLISWLELLTPPTG